MLGHCRVLDLTDEKGFLCGRILADLGADVIKIEKPGGKESGRIGPYYKDDPDPEKSLYWLSYNVNKKGITLDIEKKEGRDIFLRLAGTADFIIESYHPGFMDGIGLGYKSVKKIKKNIIYVSISPFGQKGPYKDYKASDITIMGMSGLLYLTGDMDRAPLNISIPQSYMLAGADGAVGSMIAYYNREKTGNGQFVDISMQQSSAWFLAFTIPMWEMYRTNLMRAGVMRSGNSPQRQVWPCKDGHVFFFILGGIAGARTGRQLVKWMEDKGFIDEYLMNLRWETFDMGTATKDVLDNISRPVGEFFMRLTRKEILDAAIERKIMICPLWSMSDLLNDRHLKERNFWIEIDYPNLGVKVPYPRQFINLNTADLPQRAPCVGEHNAEIYGSIGFTEQDLQNYKQAGII